MCYFLFSSSRCLCERLQTNSWCIECTHCCVLCQLMKRKQKEKSHKCFSALFFFSLYSVFVVGERAMGFVFSCTCVHLLRAFISNDCIAKLLHHIVPTQKLKHSFPHLKYYQRTMQKREMNKALNGREKKGYYKNEHNSKMRALFTRW